MTTRIACNILGPNSHWADQTDQTPAKNRHHRLSADSHILKARLASIKFRQSMSIAGEESGIIVFDSIYSVAQSQFHPRKAATEKQTETMSSVFTKDNTPDLGRAILRVSPLVLSSASLMFSWSQDISFRAFLHHSLRNDPAHPSGNVLPRYLPAFMKPGLWGIGLTYLPATALCIVNGLSNQTSEVRGFYLAGAVFSIAHFCWGPSMFAILRRIGDPQTAGVPNEDALETWLPRHHSRTLLVNVPAFLCIFAATLATITEGLR